MADNKLYESYQRREDDELNKWLEEKSAAKKQADAEAAAAKPEGAKKQPAPKDDRSMLGKGADALGNMISGAASVTKPLADVLLPPTPEGAATRGAVEQFVSEAGARVAKTHTEGRQQLSEAISGVGPDGKPLPAMEFGVNETQPKGMEPEKGQRTVTASSSVATRLMTGTLGFFNTFTPFSEIGAHAAGEFNTWLNGGVLTDEFVKSQLDFLREKRDVIPQADEQITHWERMLAMPQKEREAEMRQGAETAGAMASSAVSAYSGAAGAVKGALKGAKGSMKAAEVAGRTAVQQSAEEVARATAAKAEWGKKMAPKMLPPAPYEAPASSAVPRPVVGGTGNAMEQAKALGQPGALTTLEHGKLAQQTPDVMQWAEGIMAKVRAPEPDLEGTLKASVAKVEEGKPAMAPGAERRRAFGNQVGATTPHVALAMSRAAVGAVLGAAVGEDPETAVAGALAGLVAPKAIKLAKQAFREGKSIEEAFQAGIEAERGAKAALSETEAAGLATKAQEGGFSYQMGKKAHMAETEGYMVSIAPERGVHITGEITPADVKRFADDNAEVLKDPRAHMGAEKVDGGYNLDISIHTKSRDEAMGVGAANAQERIWDIKGNRPENVVHGPHRGVMAKAEGELSADELKAANEYDKAVTDPAQKPAWDKLIAETESEYDRLSKKLNITFVDGQPYSNIADMTADMKAGNLKVSKVAADQHPYWSADQNMKFRAVHDYYGHSKGADFSLKGEHKAFLAQADTLTSDEAKHALQTEVYGQAASFYKNQKFGDQKAFLSKENMNLPPIERRLEGGSGALPEAKVTSRGYQPGYEELPGFELFNLDEAIPGHPKGSTVSAESIQAAGYRLPAGLENALAPRGAADTVAAAMGGSKAMSEAEGRSALEQVRKNDALLQELKQMRESGEFNQSHLDTLWNIFKNQEGRIGAKLPEVKEALRLAKLGEGGQSWYKGAAEELQKHFGKDWEQVAELIAVASPVGNTEETVKAALQAFGDFKSGRKTVEEITASFPTISAWVRQAVPRILNGEGLDNVLKSRGKVWNFSRAIKGDRNAVVVDRWMWKTFYPKEWEAAEARVAANNAALKPGETKQIGGYSGTEARYKLVEDWMRTESAKMGIEASDLQAAIWVGKKIEDGSTKGTRELRAMISEVMSNEGTAKEAFDFFDNLKTLGNDQAGRVNTATMLLLARMAVGGVIGSLTGDDASSMATHALIGAGIGSVASTRILKSLKANLAPDARKGLEQLTEQLKESRNISGGSDAFIPKEVFGEAASKAVPPKDWQTLNRDLNDKIFYAKKLAGAYEAGGDDLISQALRSKHFQKVDDVFKLDMTKLAAADIPQVVADARGMRAFVLEDLLETTSRAKLLKSPESADAVAKKFAYAGRYSQRVSDMEKALGKDVLHAEHMQGIVDMDVLTKEISQIEAGLAGTVKDNRTLVEMISRTADRAAVAALAEQGSRWPQALWSIYYGLNLLSSPVTQVKNIVGNSGALLLSVADRAVGEFVVHPFSLAVGKGKGGVAFGETNQMVKGIWEMIGDSFRASKKGAFGYGKDTFWSGESAFGRETKASERLRLMAAKDAQGVEGPAGIAKVIDTLSTLAQYNLRFMDGTDEFFKILSFHGELRTQALREAKMRGFTGKALSDEMTKLIDRPTTEMLREAHYMAHENTFTKAFDPQTWGGKAEALANTAPMRIGLTPFFRTPMRVAEFSTVHTPGLNLLAKQTYSDLIAGGAKGELAAAKFLTGSAVAGYTFYLASSGLITGDWPKDPSLRAAYERARWQPRSVYNPYNGKYYSYAGLDPMASMLAGAANFAVAWPHLKDGDIDTIAIAAGLTYGKSVTDNPWMQGASDIGDVVSAMERHEDINPLLQLAQKRMLGLMPGAAVSRQIQQSTGQGSRGTDYKLAVGEDPEHRELTTLYGQFLQQAPGYGTLYGKGLPAKTNYVTGEAVPNDSGVLGLALPYQVTQNPNDPVLNKIVELGGARLPKELIRVLGGNMPRDSVIVKDGDPKEGVLLSSDERVEFGKLLATETDRDGNTLHEALAELIDSDGFKDANSKYGKDSAQADMIHDKFREFFARAEDAFKQKHPEIANIIERRALERAADRLPSSRADEKTDMIDNLLERQQSR